MIFSQSLEEIKKDLEERAVRWKEIERITSFNITTNPGIPYLNTLLRGPASGVMSSESFHSSALLQRFYCCYLIFSCYAMTCQHVKIWHLICGDRSPIGNIFFKYWKIIQCSIVFMSSQCSCFQFQAWWHLPPWVKFQLCQVRIAVRVSSCKVFYPFNFMKLDFSDSLICMQQSLYFLIILLLSLIKYFIFPGQHSKKAFSC